MIKILDFDVLLGYDYPCLVTIRSNNLEYLLSIISYDGHEVITNHKGRGYHQIAINKSNILLAFHNLDSGTNGTRLLYESTICLDFIFNKNPNFINKLEFDIICKKHINKVLQSKYYDIKNLSYNKLLKKKLESFLV